MKMKTEKIIKEIGVYILAFVAAYIFFNVFISGLGSKIVQIFSLSERDLPMLYIIFFLPPFLISLSIIYIFTKNLIKSFLISIVIEGLVFYLFALEGFISALH